MTAPYSVTKLMSLSPAEFAASAARIHPSHMVSEHGHFVFPVGEGQAEVAYRPKDPAQLGRLLHLPRGEVTVTFKNVSLEDSARFLDLFDRTFQRGGG